MIGHQPSAPPPRHGMVPAGLVVPALPLFAGWELVGSVPVVRDRSVSYKLELNILGNTQTVAYAQERTNCNPTKGIRT